MEEHQALLGLILEGKAGGTLPSITMVARSAGDQMVGFVEACLRSHADGCDPKRPVGFIEGWYVDANWRKRGVGRQLISAAEDWARAQGCVEMASDTWIDNEPSQFAHEALGFQVVDRCVNYRKTL